MAKKTDWNEDSEALGIAQRLINHEKIGILFENPDLNKIKFVRDLTSTGHKIGELKACGFPYNIDSPYTYYLVINNSIWKTLSEAKKVLTVAKLIYAVAPGGTDESSKNYAKCRKYDVKDFVVILGLAGGNFEWMEPDVDVLNPLDDSRENKETQE